MKKKLIAVLVSLLNSSCFAAEYQCTNGTTTDVYLGQTPTQIMGTVQFDEPTSTFSFAVTGRTSSVSQQDTIILTTAGAVPYRKKYSEDTGEFLYFYSDHNGMSQRFGTDVSGSYSVDTSQLSENQITVKDTGSYLGEGAESYSYEITYQLQDCRVSSYSSAPKPRAATHRCPTPLHPCVQNACCD